MEKPITNLITAHALKLEASVLQCHVCDLDQRLKKFWDLETIGIKEGEMPAYSQLIESITFQDGRYCTCVQLPWINPHPPLVDNLNLSQRRLCNLLRRLRQEPSLLQRYDTVIKEQIKEGIVEVVPDPWAPVVEKVHYLPHHGIIRDDKQTTKLRIVYDASAKEGGPSLNDCLYAGPPFGQFIFDILVRFRLHQVALVADIEKAFLMVSVAKKDMDVLRFLWVDNIHADLPNLQVLRFTRVVFGVASSPFLLNTTLRYHLEKYRSADREIVDKLERALYVDDVTYGADSVEEAFLLYTKSKLWLRKVASISERLSQIRQCCNGGSIYKNHVQSAAWRPHLHIRTAQKMCRMLSMHLVEMSHTKRALRFWESSGILWRICSSLT